MIHAEIYAFTWLAATLSKRLAAAEPAGEGGSGGQNPLFEADFGFMLIPK